MTRGNPTSGSSPSGPSTDWEALARHMAGESTPDESARVDAWLAAHPDQGETIAALASAMSRMADHTLGDIDVESALRKVKERRDLDSRGTLQVETGGARQAPARNVWRFAVPALAASTLVAIGALSFTSMRNRTASAAAESGSPVLVTGVGMTDSLTLPDESRVILGPMSSLAVSRDFGSGPRDVTVTGDAWFEVTHDGKHPFTVHAGGATIVDIGTAFTVRSHDNDGVSVSVTEGSVSMAPAAVPGPGAVILKAGDNGRLGSDGRIVTGRGMVTEDDIAWIKGRLVFRETPVAEVASVIRRWYGIQLKMNDSSMMNRRITATFDGETPAGVLDVLGLVLGADIVTRGDTAVVSPLGGRVR